MILLYFLCFKYNKFISEYFLYFCKTIVTRVLIYIKFFIHFKNIGNIFSE